MNKSYTPGPWENLLGYYYVISKNPGEPKNIDDEDRHSYEFSQFGGLMVCESVTNPANAQLIAAAPDLVEALIETLATLQNELDQSTDDNRKDYLVETIEKATVALTKAGVLTKDKQQLNNE